MTVVTRARAPHYLWGSGCDGWHLVHGPGLSVIQERMPPGTSERMHLHEEAGQFFFVLAGRATMVMGDAVIEAATGEGIEVAPGHAHQLRNGHETDLEFLVISQPPSAGDRQELA